jgi:hypothetical protein
MGWWGYGVMEGDAPLDMMSDVARAIGAQYDGGNPEAISKSRLESRASRCLRLAQSLTDDDRAVMAQVIGWLFLTRGARMTKRLKQEVLRGIGEDAWAREGDLGRVNKMIDFSSAVARYRPELGPVKLTDKGLFEVMNERLAEVQR